jgi:hypothetical protein
MAEQKRTQFTMQALGLADLFNMNVGDRKVGSFRVELSAPEGPSTGGGVQAVQHVKLVPDDGTGSVIVAGSANQIEKSAELRTWEYLAELHAQRYKGASLPVDKATYQALVARMQGFFGAQGLRVVMLDAPRPLGGARAAAVAEAKPLPVATIVAVFVGVAALVAAAMFFLLRTKHGG